MNALVHRAAVPASLGLVLGLVAAGAVCGPAAAAAPERAVLTLESLGAQSVVLRGGQDVRSIDVALPARWTRVRGELRLRYAASPLLRDDSVLEARIDGDPVAAQRVAGGAGELVVPLTDRPGSRGDVRIDLVARMRLDGIPCPPPDAEGAYIRLDPTSPLRLSGTRRGGAPALAALPGALDQRLGTTAPPVLVTFHQKPTAATIAAAATAVGEIARVTGFPGVDIRVGLPGQPRSAAPGGIQVSIRERPGAAAISLEPRRDGSLTVALAGSAATLRDAAAAISRPIARTLSGSRSADLPSAPRAASARRIPTWLPVAETRLQGVGRRQATVNVRIPEWLDVARGARLRTRVAYDVPFGGRLQTGFGAVPLDQRTLPRTGRGTFRIDALLAGPGPAQQRADLRSGDNPLTLDARLATGAAGRCRPLDEVGSVGILPGGTLRIRATARPHDPSLAAWPFPLTAAPGARGATVVLPAGPRAAEVEATLETLAEVARWSDERLDPEIAIAPARLPAGDLLLLGRGGQQIPADVRSALSRPIGAGTLASTRTGGRLVTLAGGTQALLPLRRRVYPGKVVGQVVSVTPDGRLNAIVKERPYATSAVRDDGPAWQWPLAIVVVGMSLVTSRALWGAWRSQVSMRRTAGVRGAQEHAAADAEAADAALDDAQRRRLDAWRDGPPS